MRKRHWELTGMKSVRERGIVGGNQWMAVRKGVWVLWVTVLLAENSSGFV